MAKETFVVFLEPERGHICELFDNVREELRKASRSIIKSYEYDEMRHGKQGCLFITLETSSASADCRETLERVLNHVRGISRHEIHALDTLF